MKTRLLVIIGITIMLVGGFAYLSYIQYTHYETWGNNEHWYYRGVWNNTARGCYGLYEMCEKDGGIPRFLKKSLPFPDIEENKPIEYLMDCYHGYIIEDNFLYGSFN